MSRSETVETEPSLAAPPPAKGGASDESRAGVLFARRPVHIGFSSLLTVVGGVLGCLTALRYLDFLQHRKLMEADDTTAIVFNIVCVTVIGMLLGFLLASITFRQIAAIVPKIESMSLEDKVAGLIGVILGLLVAMLLTPLVMSVPRISTLLLVLVYSGGVFLGVLFTISMKKELVGMFAHAPVADPAEEARLAMAHALPKLLDTNVIIDGRILEVWNSGFVEGELLVPQFVLDELQTIADSADDLKRARGRRGLELLNRMKAEVPNFRVLRARDYATPVGDADGVDGKLVRLALAMNASLLTNDFNLSRVAELQNIPVLNVNRLALALKPVVIAGEEMTVNIIRAGRDPGQGVAYLDDGTMVVVEDGEMKIGRVVDVVVTTTLQTVAGKMIFAVLKDGPQGPSRGNGR